MDFPCNICSQNICTDVKISQGCFGCTARSPPVSFFGLFLYETPAHVHAGVSDSNAAAGSRAVILTRMNQQQGAA